MNIVYEKIAVLYSIEQKCFHTETLLDYCKSNHKAIVLKTQQQYKLIAVCDTCRDADESIVSFRKKFNL